MMNFTFLIIFLARSGLGMSTYDHFVDPRDGEVYKVQTIGSVIWFGENLRYRTEESECFNRDETKCSEFGRFYGKEEIHSVCPEGWRLPSPHDLEEVFRGMKESGLTIYITDFEEEPGAFLVDSEDSLLYNPQFLNLFPTGWVQGEKFKIGKAAHFWVFDESQSEKNFHSHVLNHLWNLHQHDHHIDDKEKKQRKFCVRCVKDLL